MSKERRTVHWRDIGAPFAVFFAALALWEALVRWKNVPPYILPAPSVVFEKLIEDRELLFSSLMVTLGVTFEALVVATICGVALALDRKSTRLNSSHT